MRLIVMSDSHRDYDALRRVFCRHMDADLFIHLGDGEEELDLLLTQFPDLSARTWHVKGNCDYDSMSLPVLTLGLEYSHRLIATHGYQFGVNSFLEHLKALARQNDADLALFGHTHVRCARYEDGLYLLNPGSVSCPRDGMPPSYGIVDITAQGILTNIVPVTPRP